MPSAGQIATSKTGNKLPRQQNQSHAGEDAGPTHCTSYTWLTELQKFIATVGNGRSVTPKL